MSEYNIENNQKATVKDIHKAIIQANSITTTLELENQRIKYLLKNLKQVEEFASQEPIMQELALIMSLKDIYILHGMDVSLLNNLTICSL